MISSFDMVGRTDEAQGENPMKRLLLTLAAAAAIMLTACVDVNLASSAKSADGERIRLISTSLDSGSQNSGEQSAGDEAGSDTRRGDAADTRSDAYDDVRIRS